MNDLQFRLDSSNKNVEMLMEAIAEKDALIESLQITNLIELKLQIQDIRLVKR